jgi:hypothetical protein
MTAPLNRCAVEADAGESAAIGRRTRRAAELRCSGRSDTSSQTAGKAPLRLRRHCETGAELVTLIVLPPPSRCLHAPALLGRPLPRRSGAWSASTAPAASGHPWPSPLSLALRSGTLGVLPRDCACRLRPPAKPLPAGVQRVRWSRTPSAPAAPLIACRPHPRIARIVRAPHSVRRARSRGYRRPCDITRNYAAHLLCVRRGMRHPWRMKSRARVIRRYVTWPPARPCACQSAPLLRRCAGVLHALRASARHPWLAAPLHRVAVARGCSARLRHVLGRALPAGRSASHAPA